MKVLVTGDSHTGALNGGLTQLAKAGALRPDTEIAIRPLGGGHLLPTAFFEDAGDHARIVEPTYHRFFTRLPPEGPAPDCIALSMPLWPMRVMHKIVWNGIGVGARIDGRVPISHSAFRALVRQDQAQVLRLADLLQRIGVKVIAVSPPGLFRDHGILRAYPPEQALALFESYRSIMIDTLRARQITIADLPPACRDDDGFMRPAFRHPDPADEHHANADFGALMIREIEACAHDVTAA